MCIKRLAGDCPRYSFVTYNGDEYFIDIEDELAIQEKVMLVRSDETGAMIVGFSEEVESHYLSPIERRRIGYSPCEKGLKEYEQ